MPPRTVVIGVDSSTQSTKAAFVDAATGQLLAVGRAPHVVTGEAGARETDPEVWWQALRAAVAAGLKESGVPAADVTGIAVAGQQHGLVVLDREGLPLRPALLWNDTRSAPQAAALTAALGGAAAWTARTGSVPVASMTASKWQWLRENEPETAAATAAIRLPHDFLTERLTGVAVTDPGDASGTCWYSTATGAYDPELLELLGLDPALLPEVATTGAARAGSLTAEAAQTLGLLYRDRRGGGHRGQHERRGRPRSRWRRAARPPRTQPRYLGYGLRRLRDPARIGGALRFRRGGRYVPPAGLHAQLHARRGQGRHPARPGPQRHGTRRRGGAAPLPRRRTHPDLPTASGLLTGLRHDTTPQQLLGAAYEGAVVTVLRALDELLRACGLDPADPEVAARPLRLIGGGAQGHAWVETVRRLSGRPVIVPGSGELVALGAAALAQAAATGQDPVAIATSWDTGDDTQLPSVERDTATWERVGSVLERAAEPLLGGVK